MLGDTVHPITAGRPGPGAWPPLRAVIVLDALERYRDLIADSTIELDVSPTILRRLDSAWRYSARPRPCIKAFRLPRGASRPAPCVRQTAQPLTAGDRHGFPERFDLARQRFAWCMGNRCCVGVDPQICSAPHPAWTAPTMAWPPWWTWTCSTWRGCCSRGTPLSERDARLAETWPAMMELS
jgi:hypothetical protein